MKLLIATRNINKLKEYQDILEGFHLLTLNDIPQIPSSFQVNETGATFLENASLKARGYGELAKLPTLSDDSGLVIDFLNGKPGIHSARFAKGDYTKAHQKILNALKNQPSSKRTASFIISLALYLPKFSSVTSFSGEAKGLISKKPIGSSGFGYDPIFFCPEINLTFGQASNRQKQTYSHRSKAVKKLKNYLKKIKINPNQHSK